MASSWLRILAFVAIAIAPAEVRSAAIPFEGTLSVEFGVLPPIAVFGGGVAIVNGSAAIAGPVRHLAIPGGAFATTVTLAPLTPLAPIVQFQVSGANAAIAVGAGEPGCGSPQPLVTCSGAGVLQGRAGLTGVLRVGLLGSFEAPLANLSVPLAPVGGEGVATGSQTAVGATARVFGAGWTTGRVTAFGTNQGDVLSSRTARGGVGQTAGGRMEIQLVTPIVFRTSLVPGVAFPGVARLSLIFVPEPGGAAMLGLGCLLLAALGRRVRVTRRRRVSQAAAMMLLAGSFALALPSESRADLITQNRALVGSFDSTVIAPFDPALGTLDRVLVSIEGTLQQPVTVATSPPPGIQPWIVSVPQRFFGLAGRGFEFDGDAQIRLLGTTSVPFASAVLRYAFAFSAASDVVGFALPTVSGPFLAPPTSIVGTRSDFAALPFPGDPGIEIDMLLGAPAVLLGPVQPGAPAFAGVLSVQYQFTPLAPQPPPLDASLVLVARTNDAETLAIHAIDPETDEVLTLFEPGDVRLPVVIGGLWNDADGSVPLVHENDAIFPDVVVVKRLARDGTISLVTMLGGLSGKPGATNPSDTALLADGVLAIADTGASATPFAPDGKLLRVELDTGSVSPIASGAFVNPTQIAVAPSGTLFVADFKSIGDAAATGVLLAVDPVGGGVVQLAASPELAAAADLAVAPDGQILWLDTQSTPEGAALLRIDPANGAIERIAERVVDARGIYVRSSGIGAIALPQIGIVAFSVDGAEANADAVATFEADYYLEEFDFDRGEELDGDSEIPTSPPATACNDGEDNDADGEVDLADAGCRSPADRSEQADCDNGLDDDGDGDRDRADAGCASALDPSERPGCSDGLDNDGDGAIDFPADPGCLGPESADEASACANGVDDDGDGAIDAADVDCLSAADASESTPECDNGIDDDGDLLVDFGEDPGCRTAFGDTESPACDDGLDNDGDGAIDTGDSGCRDAASESENQSCSDRADNDGDGTIDFGLVGGSACEAYEDCTGGFASCDGVCFGGPRAGQDCQSTAECRVDCVDALCEEAALPRSCANASDCDGAPCNSQGRCVGADDVPADSDCVEIGSEEPGAIAGPAGCGLGVEVVLACGVLFALRRNASRRC